MYNIFHKQPHIVQGQYCWELSTNTNSSTSNAGLLAEQDIIFNVWIHAEISYIAHIQMKIPLCEERVCFYWLTIGKLNKFKLNRVKE